MDDNDTLTKWTGRPGLTPSQIGGKQAPPPPPGGGQPPGGEEDTERFPQAGDPYEPHSAFSSRLKNRNRRSVGPRMLHFLDEQCWSIGFSYGDLRQMSWKPGDKPGDGPQLVLRFIESKITDVVIQGRNLEEMRHGISEGHILWVRTLPASGIQVLADGDPVITAIVFRTV